MQRSKYVLDFFSCRENSSYYCWNKHQKTTEVIWMHRDGGHKLMWLLLCLCDEWLDAVFSWRCMKKNDSNVVHLLEQLFSVMTVFLKLDVGSNPTRELLSRLRSLFFQKLPLTQYEQCLNWVGLFLVKRLFRYTLFTSFNNLMETSTICIDKDT